MKPVILFLVTLITRFLPETRFFALKRTLYRLAGANIGFGVRICSSVQILGNGKLNIGDNSWIGHQSLIISTSMVTVGSNCDIAPRVYIGTGTHKIDTTGLNTAGTGISCDIKIGDGVWLGAHSTILPGVEIGEKSVIAAGAVVNKSSDSFSLVGGVPAKFIKKL